MDTMQTEAGKTVVIVNTGSKISTRSTRRRKTTLLNPLKMILYFQGKHPSKSFEEGIAEHYKNHVIESPTFLNYFKPANKDKNYSIHVWLNDITRVTLPDPDFYYHASYVDGLRPKQYILAQAPLNAVQQTNFFKMLQHVKCEAVVIIDGVEQVTNFICKGREEKTGEKSVEKTNEDVSILQVAIPGLKDLKVVKWNKWDAKQPTEMEFVDAHEKIRNIIGSNQKNPIVIVCADGATKSGIFVLLDIEAERYKEKGKVKFADTIKHIRLSRTNTFDTVENFAFASSVIVEYCKRAGKK